MTKALRSGFTLIEFIVTSGLSSALVLLFYSFFIQVQARIQMARIDTSRDLIWILLKTSPLILRQLQAVTRILTEFLISIQIKISK